MARDMLNGERIVTECSLSPFSLMLGKIGVGFWLAFTVLIFVVGTAQHGIVGGFQASLILIFVDAYVAYRLYAKMQTKFILTNKRLIGTKGVFKKEKLDVPLEKIDNVSVKTGVTESVGDLTVFSNKSVFVIPKLGDPGLMRLAILEQIDIYKQEQAEMHAEKIANAVK